MLHYVKLVWNAAKMTVEQQREKRSNELGPIGRQVAANVRRFRDNAKPRMSTQDLAKRMTDLGRPIAATGITRIESGQRRVDADDLVALAVALGVTPTLLLLPPDVSDDDVAVTPTRTAPWLAAWRWATGDQPLLKREEELPVDDPRVRSFISENRPHEAQPIYEAAMLLAKRERTPFAATILHDGTDGRARITHGDVDLEAIEGSDGER